MTFVITHCFGFVKIESTLQECENRCNKTEFWVLREQKMSELIPIVLLLSSNHNILKFQEKQYSVADINPKQNPTADFSK